MTSFGRWAFRFAMVARMSGFSTSDSSGVGLPDRFLELLFAGIGDAPVGDSRSEYRTSAGNARSTACSISRAVSTLIDFDARRVGHIHRPAHQRYIRTGRSCGSGDGMTLFAG